MESGAVHAEIPLRILSKRGLGGGKKPFGKIDAITKLTLTMRP